jgi:hypothetical protein
MPTLCANDFAELFYLDVGSADAPVLILVSLKTLSLLNIIDWAWTVAWLHRLLSCVASQYTGPIGSV